MNNLDPDETLLIQSGKLAGVWETFRDLDDRDLTMYGQMTAGSRICIETQGILQDTHETFTAAARWHFGGTLSGRVVLAAGLGGMGGAQPLAATMNSGAAIVVEVDRDSIARLAETTLLRDRHPRQYIERSMASMARPMEAMAFDIPGFVPEYVRPLFCEGKGPFRWAALSGDPDDMRVTHDVALEMFSESRGIRLPMGERVPQQRSVTGGA